MTEISRTEWGVSHQHGVATGAGLYTEKAARDKYLEMWTRWQKTNRSDVREPILVTRTVTDWHPHEEHR
jgi:hypothetical protein